ncbi:MAG: hydrogenase accessory protein [Rhodobacteraceae bacterium]|nr:hydrogenase accessory protein [Paracoccaceae bacterium]
MTTLTLHPLIARLTDEFGWPMLTNAHDVAEFTGRPGVHAIFVPGDAARNLETPDVAVILPELKMAFQGAFDCAICDGPTESTLKEATKVHKTPSILFYRGGQFLAGIPRVRDWDDYVVRITQILAQPAA